jgi:hypothetical protein
MRRYALTMRFDLDDDDADERALAVERAAVATFRVEDGLREAELIAEAAPNWTRVNVLDRTTR